MKILILTQKERLYLPSAFARVCREFAGDVAAIVAAPAMSTHGGFFKGLKRHVDLFGVRGVARLAIGMGHAMLRDQVSSPGTNGRFYSVRAVADAFDIEYHEVAKLKSQDFQDVLDRFTPDLLVSISCPQIVGRKIREQFPKGAINVHGAPLPKYRGLMPAFWMLKNGESEAAVTVHDLEKKLDDGDILIQESVPITPTDTWNSLVRKTKHAGADALIKAIHQIEQGTVQRRPNPESEATYYSFPTRQDRREFLAAGRRFF